jgi:uncharacterized HhH-GPD family protein
MYLASTEDANALLESDPFALLLGMMLDQQIPMEKAFTSPAVLRERLGDELSAAQLVNIDPEQLDEVFRRTPALHRFPAAMAVRAQELARIVVDTYGGDAGAVWTTAKTGGELVKRLEKLPGFGAQKARMFAALVGKQLGAQPAGWQEAAHPYAEPGTFASAADVVDADSLAKVKAYKRDKKAAAKQGA